MHPLKLIAEIAQLVEHNLAKVGVASSSLVFRSLFEDARMVESVDTRDLKSLGHCGCAGSSPASSTKKNRKMLINSYLRFSFCIIAPHLHHRQHSNRKFIEFLKVLDHSVLEFFYVIPSQYQMNHHFGERIQL